MSSQHENLDQDTAEDFGDILFDDPLVSEFSGQESSQNTSPMDARSRLEALREKRALRKAIYDDLYYDEDLGDD